jgi:hypothetical protein
MLTLKLHDKQTVVVCPLLEKQTVVVCPLLKINHLIYYFISVQTLSNFSLILIYSFCLNVHFYDNEFQYRSFKNNSYPENCTIAVTFCLQAAYSTINCLCVHLSDLFINLTQVFYIMRKVTM